MNSEVVGGLWRKFIIEAKSAILVSNRTHLKVLNMLNSEVEMEID